MTTEAAHYRLTPWPPGNGDPGSTRATANPNVCAECGRVFDPADPTDAAELPALLNEKQLAAWLNVAPQTVRQWRYRHEGPPSVKVGGSVRYQRDDVEQWLAATNNGAR